MLIKVTPDWLPDGHPWPGLHHLQLRGHGGEEAGHRATEAAQEDQGEQDHTRVTQGTLQANSVAMYFWKCFVILYTFVTVVTCWIVF